MDIGCLCYYRITYTFYEFFWFHDDIYFDSASGYALGPRTVCPTEGTIIAGAVFGS